MITCLGFLFNLWKGLERTTCEDLGTEVHLAQGNDGSRGRRGKCFSSVSLAKNELRPKERETKHGHHHPRPSYRMDGILQYHRGTGQHRYSQCGGKEAGSFCLSSYMTSISFPPHPIHSSIITGSSSFFPFSVFFFFFLYIYTTRRTGTGLYHIEWLAYSP